MEIFIFVVVIAIVILVVGILIDNRIRTRVRDALKALDKGGSKPILQSTIEAGRIAYTATAAVYVLIVAVFIIVSITSVDAMTLAKEPRADLMGQFMFSAFIYGPVILAVLIAAGFLLARCIQVLRIRHFLGKQKQSIAVKNTRNALETRIGELGVYAISTLAVLASLVSGAVILALLFSASQAAIECARSSKCM